MEWCRVGGEEGGAGLFAEMIAGSIVGYIGKKAVKIKSATGT